MLKTDSLFLCLNAQGGEPPKTIELIPPGATVPGRDGRSWKNTRPESVAKNSMSRIPRLVIDENHATDLSATKGGPSPAMGWITALAAGEGGGITAEVEWTKRGREAVLNREYSYISPVFLFDSAGEIMTILRAALTNTPNLNLPALNSENQLVDNNTDNNTEEQMKKELCAELGLPETAGDAEVVAATKALNSEKRRLEKATGVDTSAYAPRAELNAAQARAEAAEKQVAALNAEQTKRDAVAVVDGAIRDGKIAPASKDSYLALCSDVAGIEKVKAALAASPAGIVGKENQAPDGSPASAAGVALNAEEAGLAKAMGYTPEEFSKIKEGKK